MAPRFYRVLRLSMVVILLLVFSSCGSKKALEPGVVPNEYTRLFLLEGDSTHIGAFQGKHLVVLFWGTWCSFSRPFIERLNEYVKERALEQRVAFVAVSLDKHSDREKLEERIQAKKLTALQHMFSGNMNLDPAAMEFSVSEVPKLFVLDPSGKIIYTAESFSSTKDFLDKLFL